MPEVLQIGDVRLWIEQQESIHLKVTSPYNDPVELTSVEAGELAAALLALASRIEDYQQTSHGHKR